MSPRWKAGRRGRGTRLLHGGLAAGLVAVSSCSSTRGEPMAEAAPEDGRSGRGASGAGASAIAGNGGGAPDAGPVGGGAGAGTLDGGAPPAGLDMDAVGSGSLARNVLWSWTSARQIAELRSDPVLLTRSESSTGQRTNLSVVLARLASDGDPLAQILASPSFAKGRYAWANAWATARGWPDESYGDQLLRIVLRPEALLVVARFGGLEVLDMQNQVVDLSVALGEPERIGAVYFVSEAPDGGPACGTFVGGCATGAYREYFIDNERMVMEWSLGTQAILDELDRGIAVANDVRAQIETGALGMPEGCDFTSAAYCAWDFSLAESYYSALALTSSFYEPTLANMDALIAVLEAARFTPDPLVHEP